MSYGPCVKCPSAVAAWQLSAAALDAVPESQLLCLEHLRELIATRGERSVRAEREKLRRYCPCGRELYLMPIQRDAIGDPCAWCKLGQPVSVDVVDGGRTALRASSQLYSQPGCDADGCDAKMVYLLPDRRIVCDKHATEERVTP